MRNEPTDPGGPQVGWPLDKQEIEVLCITKGGSYRNTIGQLVNDWYRIRVPDDKVEPASKSRAEKDARGYVAYVGISWVKPVGAASQAPAC